MYVCNNTIKVLCDGVFVVIFFKTMYNKTIIRFGFCDILNNQGICKCYQPWSSTWLITFTSTLIHTCTYVTGILRQLIKIFFLSVQL